MLIYFKVGNYKSIKEPVVLNFTAAPISEHINSNLVTIGKHQILKSMVLYGHNASGKSKLLDAISFFKTFVTESALQKKVSDTINTDPFRLNKETEDKPSLFEACFLLDGFTYRYGFEVDQKRVHKEWLLQSRAEKEYPVFLRIQDEYEINTKKFENSQGLDKRTRENSLFLSVASHWNVPQAVAINKWISSIQTLSGLYANRAFKSMTIRLMSDPLYANLIQEFLKKADLDIQAVEVSDINIPLENSLAGLPDDLRERMYKAMLEMEDKSILTLHNKYDATNNLIGTTSFLLDKDESEGTQKYFSLIGLILMSIYEGNLVIIDEFDARLHTLLSRAIIKLFNSSKIKTNGQLVVASHDTALLDKNILRRDQIYFVEKDNFGASSITSLVEYKPRKESPYDRNYLEGKYGAIPFIDDLETLVINGKKST